MKELHVSYKEKYPQHKVGLSIFCELHPKRCATISSPGGHSVRVYTYNQNTKLLIDDLCTVINKLLKEKAREHISDKEVDTTEVQVPKFIQGSDGRDCL